MNVYLFTVEGVFRINGRGTMLAPGVSEGLRVHAGDTVELRLPHGAPVQTAIIGIELISRIHDDCTIEHTAPILIAGAIDVPEGTEVWLVDKQ